MKTIKLLSLLAAAAAVVFALNVSAADPMLTPRAKENQMRKVPTVANQPDLAAARNFTVSPRALENQRRMVRGTTDSVSHAATCRMIGSPKQLETARNAAGCCCRPVTASCQMDTACCAMN